MRNIDCILEIYMESWRIIKIFLRRSIVYRLCSELDFYLLFYHEYNRAEVFMMSLPYLLLGQMHIRCTCVFLFVRMIRLLSHTHTTLNNSAQQNLSYPAHLGPDPIRISKDLDTRMHFFLSEENAPLSHKMVKTYILQEHASLYRFRLRSKYHPLHTFLHQSFWWSFL